MQNRQTPSTLESSRQGDASGGVSPVQRLWTADRLDVRLRQGRIGPSQVHGLAAALRQIHAEPAPEHAGGRGDVVARVRRASAALRTLGPENAAVARLERDVFEALDRCAPAVAARSAAGEARRLHGTLRAEHIHIDPAGRAHVEAADSAGTCAGDCAEDLASLLVRVAADGQPDFARRVLASYAEVSGDYALFPVIDVYVGVAALEAAREALEAAAGADRAGRRRAAAAAKRLLDAPRRLAPGRRRPRVLAFGGIMASGKSTLSERLAARLGAPRISADAVRARLGKRAARAGAAPLEGFEDEATEAVYAAVLHAAGDVLGSGRTVVIDATFPTRALRAQLRALAGSLGVELRFVECRTDAAVVRRRLEARARAQHRDESEWLTLLDRFLATWEPIEEFPPSQHLPVDTTRDPRACLERMEASLGIRTPAPHRVSPAPVWAQTSA